MRIKLITPTLFCLFFCLLSTTAVALEFNSILSLTLGLPGDQPFTPRVAYNSKRDEYMVVYQYRSDFLPGYNNSQIHAARISADGSHLVSYVISDKSYDCETPDIDYDPVHDRYLVVWSYDSKDDGRTKRIYGRIVPWNGPVATLPSFTVNTIGFQPTEETHTLPRVAYGSSNQDFFIVFNYYDLTGGQTKIGGFRVPADGSAAWHYTNISDGASNIEHLFNPDIAYNPHRHEFMVVFERYFNIGSHAFTDIYGSIFTGKAESGNFHSVTDIGYPINLDHHFESGSHGQLPAISFSSFVKYYMITWRQSITGATSDTIYARYYPGTDTASNSVYTELLDSNNGFSPQVACSSSKPDCLAVWSTRNDDTIYTIGRMITLKTSTSGDLTSHDTTFYKPIDNLGPAGLATGAAAVVAGRKNYYYTFLGVDQFSIRHIYGRNTHKPPPFAWPLFLQAIIGQR